MIVRVFRVRIHPGKEDEFERFVTETGIPTVKAQPGRSHVTAGQSRWSEQPEFVVVGASRSANRRHSTEMPLAPRAPAMAALDACAFGDAVDRFCGEARDESLTALAGS